ncbi:MAG: hypothetical protein JO202_14705 [Ktedonobacteraceae bacterium]|nr:hypothetical protein [Ktedonobacteraceae bacterium]
MTDRYAAHVLTLAESHEDDLYDCGVVTYRVTKCAFNADSVLFTRMSSEEPPIQFMLYHDELKEFLEVYQEYQQDLKQDTAASAL